MTAETANATQVTAGQICVGDTIEIVSVCGDESYRYLVTDRFNPPPVGTLGMPLDYMEGLLLESDAYRAYRLDS